MKWNGDDQETRQAWSEVSRAYREWRRVRSPECVERYVKNRAVAIRLRERRRQGRNGEGE